MANASQGRTLMVQGRLVWLNGDLFKGATKKVFGTQTPVLGPDGQPQMQYGFGLAVPKANCAEVWNALHEEAFTLFPSRQVPPSFALKFKDGDGIDDKGQPFSQRSGYAGHIVLSCTTSLPIKFFRWENGQNIMINDGIKCGDYVNVQLSIKAHPAIGAGKAGLYVNPMAVQFLGYGEAIVNAPSGDQIFGMSAPTVPQGASATPMAPQPGQMLVPPSAPQTQGYTQPVAPPSYAPPVQQAPPAPHHAVLPPQFQPQQAPPVQQGFPQAPQPYPQPGTPPGYSTPPGYPQQGGGMPPMPGMPGQ